MKKIRIILATVLAVVMCMSVTIPAFAAGPAAERPVAVMTEPADSASGGSGGIMPLLDYTHTIGPNWVTIASGRLSGLGIRIDVHDFNSFLHKVNVDFYRNGLWIGSSNNVGGTTTVYCPTDTTEVKMQIVPRFLGVQDHWYHVTITY